MDDRDRRERLRMLAAYAVISLACAALGVAVAAIMIWLFA